MDEGTTRDVPPRDRGGADCPVCGSSAPAELNRFAARHGLTRRELQVARCAATGSSSAEIAAHLYLSPRTVEGHLLRTYQKLGVHTRVRLALRLQDLDSG
jgi:DNA-binding CsgD family transcriptional regulator